MKDQLTRINEFVDSLEETSLNEDQQSILLSPEEIMGCGNNGGNCTNATEGCLGSTNNGSCVNDEHCIGSTNVKDCKTLPTIN